MANDKYASERGEPDGATCGAYGFLFDGYYLKLFAGAIASATVLQAWHARSGHKVGANFDYSVARQKVAGNGPIPEGDYWIKPSQLREFMFADDGWGVARITIHPRTATVTHSRGGFFIHGGKVFGSSGCIDLASGMDSFRNKLKTLAPPIPRPFPHLDAPNTCTIPLTVAYAASSVGDP
jgi:Protein of unknown function (DUF2778)